MGLVLGLGCGASGLIVWCGAPAAGAGGIDGWCNPVA